MADPNIRNDWKEQALDSNTRIRKQEGYAVRNTGQKCSVTVDSGTPGGSNTLEMAGGEILFDGEVFSIDQRPVSISKGDQNRPRKDVVYLDTDDSGTLDVHVSKGTPEAATPSGATRWEAERPAPDDLAGKSVVPLAVVWVNSRPTTITKQDIRDVRVFAEVSYGSVKAKEFSVGEETYISAGEVEPVSTIRGADTSTRASTTSTSFTTVSDLFEAHVRWDRLPEAEHATSASVWMDPGLKEDMQHRLWNRTDQERVKGTTTSANSTESKHSAWDAYTPSTENSAITIVSAITTSRGGNHSGAKNVTLWVGRQL